jgi:hypothetical protein
MAISLSGRVRRQHQQDASKRIARQERDAMAAEGKRKGRAGLFGKIGGAIMGAGAVGLMGLTGGLAAPLVMGVAASLGKKWSDEASKGALGKMFKSPGQVGAIKAGGMGYGKQYAKEAQERLTESRKTDFSAETMLGDIAGSYIGAGLSGGLTGGAKALFSGKEGSIGKALTGQTGSYKFGGLGGAKESILGLLPVGADAAEEAVDPSTISLTDSLEGSGLGREQYDKIVESAQAGYVDDDLPFGWDDEVLDIGQSYETQTGPVQQSGIFAQGGQVMDQNTLIGLALLSQMSNGQTAYEDTPLEEEKQLSIAEIFASKGKTLGGSNTQSLSQMLGR